MARGSEGARKSMEPGAGGMELVLRQNYVSYSGKERLCEGARERLRDEKGNRLSFGTRMNTDATDLHGLKWEIGIFEIRCQSNVPYHLNY